MVLGDDDKDPTPAELDRMRELVRQAMRDGAVGLSTSLQYPPAPYAETDELIALASEAAKLGGVYATHLRNESDEILPALDEAIRIGREAGIPVEIWHLKTAGKKNWGRMPEVVAKIDSRPARRTWTSRRTPTPIPRGSTRFSSFVPPWAHDGGNAKLLERLRDPEARRRIRKDMRDATTPDWDNSWKKIPGPEAIMIGAVQNPALRRFQGKTLAEVAQARGSDPIDALLDFLMEDKAYTFVAVFGMSEPDVALALEQPWVSINCDSEGAAPKGILSQSHPHPRAYGTFPRILRKYVREEKRLTLEDAIRKFTSLAGAADAAGRSRGAEGRDVGRRGGLRSGDGPRPRDLRAAAPVGGGDAVGAGERRAGHRGGQGDGRGRERCCGERGMGAAT